MRPCPTRDHNRINAEMAATEQFVVLDNWHARRAHQFMQETKTLRWPSALRCRRRGPQQRLPSAIRFVVDAFDISSVAIAKAHQLAASSGVRVTYQVADCDSFSWMPTLPFATACLREPSIA